MSTTSKPRALGTCAGALALLLGACLPGPWSYVPESRPVFRGITVSGYAVADRPVEHLCFEKLLALEEASTDAFAFYDSASVTISGSFSDGAPSVSLTPDINTPNCFRGPAGSRFVRDRSYQLNARFVWDSGGTASLPGAPVVTTLSATARIPETFAIADSAWAPSLVQVGLALDQVTDPDVFNRLPPGPRALFIARYGDTLTALDGDSAGLARWTAANGARMRAELLLWLKADVIHYGRGDSVFYVYSKDKATSNLSHFFQAHRDPLVRGVLISHRFDTTGRRPVTAFDTLAGIPPDTTNFYSVGDHRRLIYYADYPNPDGRHTLDSMAVFNPWFWSGRNRLYFYGVEAIYNDFQIALQEAGGNSKIVLPTNVTGGRGFFAGMVVDSFDIHVRLDSNTQAFPYAQTRALACRDKGWFENRDCVGYYPEYCADNGWIDPDCRVDAIHRCVDATFRAANASVCSYADAVAAADSALAVEALVRYCVVRDYPADFPGCAETRQACEQGGLGNGCQQVLWTHCELNHWKPAQCAEGLRSFCAARRDVHRVMCRDVP